MISRQLLRRILQTIQLFLKTMEMAGQIPLLIILLTVMTVEVPVAAITKNRQLQSLITAVETVPVVVITKNQRLRNLITVVEMTMVMEIPAEAEISEAEISAVEIPAMMVPVMLSTKAPEKAVVVQWM